MTRRLDRSLLGLLVGQFREFWYFYLMAVAGLFATHTIQSYLPFMAKDLADTVDDKTTSVNGIIFVYFALGIIVFRTLSRLLFFHPARILQKYLRLELLERLSSSPPARYHNYSSGQLFQMMGNDMEEIRALIGFALLQVSNVLVAVIVLVPKIVNFHSELTIAILPMLGAFMIFIIIISRNKKYFRLTQDCQGEVSNLIIESYQGKKTIKNYHAEKSFINLFKEYCSRELGFFFRSGIGTSISIPLIPLGVGLSLLWGGHIIQTLNLGRGALVLFSSFIFLFLEPLAFLSWIGIVFARSMGSWSRIKELLHCLDKESTMEKMIQKYNSRESSKSFTLDFWNKAVEITIIEGAKNVIVGKTGHGKTHLLLQLAELYNFKKRNLSYVAQHPYLYNDSIENNIFLGQTPTKQQRNNAEFLLELFHFDHLDNSGESLMPMEIGENGKKLSGGQQKRLALIRSLMSEADILIWDDPFSSVDLILEKTIVQSLKKNGCFDNKTVILTTHRLSTTKSSHYVTYIDRDKGILDKGEVKHLLKKGLPLYEYFKNQFI